MKKSLFLILTLFALTAFAQSERLNGTVAERSGNNPTAPVPIADPGFEIGSGWTEYSLNYGSPVCDAGGCGVGGGTGPNSGSFWAWFGGHSGSIEEASVAQSVSIPSAASVTLSFYLETPVCDGTGYLEILINGNQEYYIDETYVDCNVIGYNQINVDLSSYQGQTVNLDFNSIVQGDDIINFFVDDVSLDASGTPPSAAATAVPTLKWYGMGLMLLVLGFIGVRRFN